MPYKIYTYADPYNLDKADYWDEIASLPHFCSARTLVNGLNDVIGESIKGLICDFDALIDHENVFKQWTKNVGRQVQQYSVLSTAFKRLLDNGKITKEFHLALSQNQNYFLEAIRLFIELGISASSINGDKGNLEQKLFVYMLSKAQKNELFQFPRTPSREELQAVFQDLAKKEIEDCKKERDIVRCKRALSITEQQPFNAIVIHGVHQFKPVQLRLLIALEKMGVTIIFLFNYQKEYSKIYSSWEDIYSCFDTVPHHDSIIPAYHLPTMQNPSNALACAIGELCEDRQPFGNAKLRKWHQLYKSIELREFANITEYAHYVSNHVETARNKYNDSRRIMERGNEVWDNRGVLAFLDEQVYTANRDIHTLLNIYYPEFSPDRHFLSYPIGQFFSAIYRLWDYEKKSILFDANAIKECLSSNILKAAPGEVLLRTFYNTSVLFEHITTYEEFENNIAEAYLQCYDRISSAKSTDPVFPLKQLVIYNKYKVAKKDIETMVRAIREINEIAKRLFLQDKTHEEYINFGEHFSKLEEFLKQRELALANEKERELICALQLRLSQITPENTKFSGTFRDLKEGIYYFLKQKGDAEQSPDWIVKNFEQIDGDILQSKRQFEREQIKTYHFACLSDRDMNMTVNDQLPWPLTDEFLSVAYLPQDLQFQIYSKTLERRSDFLRYALFYGLCYNRCNVRLSYVQQYGDEITEPYALLSILGFQPKPGPIEKVDHNAPFNIIVPQQLTKGIKYNNYEMMDMFLCPYRYFLDYVMSDSPVVHGSFLFQKYYENLVIEAVWKRIKGQKKQDAEKYLSRIIDQESDKLSPYFKFWKETEIIDLKRRARNYLEHELINNGPGAVVSQYNDVHMQIRKQFGAAMFVVDISEVERRNPYNSFDALASRCFPKKKYSLHSLPGELISSEAQQLVDALRDDAKSYINQSDEKDKTAIPSDWCVYCPHRGTCMESFLAGELIESTQIEGKETSRRERITAKRSFSRTDQPIASSALSVASDAVISDIPAVQNLVQESENHNQTQGYRDESNANQAIVSPKTSYSANDTASVEEASLEHGSVERFESILRMIQDMVSENSQEILSMKRELATKRTRKEDTSKIEAILEEQERKSQDLLDRLSETEGRLASTEAKNRMLADTVKTQNALLEKQKMLEFSEAESQELQKYSSIIVFDTCSIMNYPNLLGGVQDGELVVVPKDVNNELENHKTNHLDDRRIKAQRAITSIFNYKRRYPLIYSDAMLDLVPQAYRAEAGERELTDNKILSVAIRYQKYSNVPVVFITDDRSLSNKAAGEGIEVWTAEDFLAPPDSIIQADQSGSSKDTKENRTNSDSTAENNGEAIQNSSAEKEKPDSKTDSDEPVASGSQGENVRVAFLAQKISTKILNLDARQISVLQNNGIKTVSDYMGQTEETFKRMKAKKGMSFAARYLDEQKRLRAMLSKM